MTILWKNVSSPPRWVNFFRLKRTVRRLHNQRPVLKPGFSGRHNHSESIRAASSDFEARRLLRQNARHRRQRAPGTGPMLVPSLQRYQACPLSKPGVGFGFEIASTVVPKRDAHRALESSLTALENVSAVEAILKTRARG